MNNGMRSAGAAVASLLLAFAGCAPTLPWERDWGASTSSSSLGGATHPSLTAAAQGRRLPIPSPPRRNPSTRRSSPPAIKSRPRWMSNPRSFRLTIPRNCPAGPSN